MRLSFVIAFLLVISTAWPLAFQPQPNNNHNLNYNNPNNKHGSLNNDGQPSVFQSLDQLAQTMDDGMRKKLAIMNELKESMETLAILQGAEVLVSDEIARGVLHTISQLRMIRDRNEKIVLEELERLNFSMKNLASLKALKVEDVERIESSLQNSLRLNSEAQKANEEEQAKKDVLMINILSSADNNDNSNHNLPASSGSVAGVSKKLVVQAIESHTFAVNRKQKEAVSTINTLTSSLYRLFDPEGNPEESSTTAALLNDPTSPTASDDDDLERLAGTTYSISEVLWRMDGCMSGNSEDMIRCLQKFKTTFSSFTDKRKGTMVPFGGWRDSQVVPSEEEENHDENEKPSLALVPSGPVNSYRVLFRTVLQHLGNEELSTLEPMPDGGPEELEGSVPKEPELEDMLANVNWNHKETVELLRSITMEVDKYVQAQVEKQKLFGGGAAATTAPPPSPPTSSPAEPESAPFIIFGSDEVWNPTSTANVSSSSEITADGMFLVEEIPIDSTRDSQADTVWEPIDQEYTADGFFVVEEVDFHAGSRKDAAKNNTASAHYEAASKIQLPSMDFSVGRQHNRTMNIIHHVSDRVKEMLEKNKARQERWQRGRSDGVGWQETELTQAIFSSILKGE